MERHVLKDILKACPYPTWTWSTLDDADNNYLMRQDNHNTAHTNTNNGTNYTHNSMERHVQNDTLKAQLDMINFETLNVERDERKRIGREEWSYYINKIDPRCSTNSERYNIITHNSYTSTPLSVSIMLRGQGGKEKVEAESRESEKGRRVLRAIKPNQPLTWTIKSALNLADTKQSKNPLRSAEFYKLRRRDTEEKEPKPTASRVIHHIKVTQQDQLQVRIC